MYYQVKDNADVTSITYTDTIILDTTAPTGSIIINNDNPYTASTAVTLSLTATDSTSGISEVRLSNDGVWDTEPWEPQVSTKSWTLSPGDGAKTVYYQIRDNAGLTSTAYSDTITIDTVAPEGSILINGGDTYTTSTSITLTLTASDARAPQASIKLDSATTEHGTQNNGRRRQPLKVGHCSQRARMLKITSAWNVHWDAEP